MNCHILLNIVACTVFVNAAEYNSTAETSAIEQVVGCYSYLLGVISLVGNLSEICRVLALPADL